MLLVFTPGLAVYYSRTMKRSSLYIAVLSLALDVVAVFAGLMLAYSVRADGTQLYFWPMSAYLQFVLYILPVWVVFFISQGLYNTRSLPSGWAAFGRVLVSVFAGWGSVLIILYLWHSPQAQAFPRLVVLYGLLYTTVFCLLAKIILTWIIRFSFKNGNAAIRTVVIAPGPNNFTKQLQSNPVHGRKLLEVLGSDGAEAKLAKLIAEQHLEEIIVDDPKISDSRMLTLLNFAEEHNLNFVLVPSLLSVRTTNVAISTMAGTPVMQFLRTPLEGWRRIYKRLFDIVLSGLALIIFSPILLLLAIIVKISSPGPIFFGQARIGQDGKQFFVHKFRSMYKDGDERFKQFAGWSGDEKTDPRITPVGRVLRRTNLDELPQLWDIFRGAMSIVGPRPEQPKYVEKFSHEIPNYLRRHHIKTGLTGWAQVNGLRGDTSIADRVKYDLYYIENWSIWLDIRIILSTIILTLREITGAQSR